MSANAASSATDPAFFVCSSPDVAKSSSAHQKVLGLERWVQGRDVHVMTSPPSTESWSKIRPWDKSFDIPTFFQHLKTRPGDGYGRSLLYSRCLPSTQTLLTGKLSGSEPGFVCIADAQSAGKGRGSNSWESPPGCLMFSFSTRVQDGRSLPFVQYMVSLAMVKAIGSVPGLAGSTALGSKFVANDLSRPIVRLKWPNDVYIERPAPPNAASKGHGAACATSFATETSDSGSPAPPGPSPAPERLKIGGVLCQSSKVSGVAAFEVVAGVGINVDNAEPTVCLNSALRLDAAFQESPQTPAIRRAELLARFFNHYEKLHTVFEIEGFAPMLDDYLLAWMHSGQTVTATVGGGSQTLTIRGLAETGALLAEDASSECHELYPDGNSFDMMKGMISEKKR
jgi:biotin--protein ligase